MRGEGRGAYGVVEEVKVLPLALPPGRLRLRVHHHPRHPGRLLQHHPHHHQQQFSDTTGGTNRQGSNDGMSAR